MVFNELLNLVSLDKAPGICIDSRLVKAGDIFVAVKGTLYDGHDFIDQAVARGAKYIVCQQYRRQRTEDRRQTKHEIVIVKDSTKAAAILAQASRGNPASKLTNLAVTGTNGKTTVAYLVRSVMQADGEKCGLISTIVYDCLSTTCQAGLTTPDCLDIAEVQSQMVKAGSKYMVIEASSHALSQNRLAGINFKAAAFTNLAGDHLDYHKTEKEYLAAKARLFQGLSSDSTAVLNKQSPAARQIAAETRAKLLWYAIDEPAPLEVRTEAARAPIADSLLTGPADIIAYIESMDINGAVFTLETRVTGHGSRATVSTSLLGRYNVANHLAAAGLCLAAGFDLETIAAGLSALKVIPGRLEKVDSPRHEPRATGHVFVDYAHTDDALKNVLSTLQPLCKGKLRVVFGCGGDRDRTKRPRMAKVAEQLADFVIVTSDNPRTERPEYIIGEIVAGFENPTSEKITVEVDRRKAIELAIKTTAKDDIVLIAGKGHETYQIIGNQKFKFNDKKVAEECLKKRVRNRKLGSNWHST